ncbi:MAG: cytochrome b/b6 domain-containing protein [Candidatus Binatia bacterium]
MTQELPPTVSSSLSGWEASADEFDPLELGADEEFDPCLDADVLESVQCDRPYYRLHLWYSAVVLVLIFSGLPIQFPDLRAKLIGGYGSSIAAVHEWTGVAMTVLPVLAFAVAPSRAFETIRLRSWRRDDFGLHAVNLWFTLVSGAVFIISGLLMWFPASMSDAVLDVSAELHRAFAYVLYAAVPLHLISSRVRIVASVSGWWARVHPRRVEDRPQATTEDPPC